MLPSQIIAQDLLEESNTDTAGFTDDTSSNISNAENDDRSILMEIVDKRTEYSKEYKLVNGMHMTVMYPEAVHYEKDGKWEDIDSTLKIVSSGDTAVYTNTADAWQVMLPKELGSDASVSITKDGYTVSFQLAGEIKTLSASSTATLRMGNISADKNVSISNARDSEGQVHLFDYSQEKARSEYPDTVRDKLKSRMSYANVYQNTDIVYDLSAQQLKESIVINAYDSSLYGYQYTLNVGKMVPVLNDDGSIDLFVSKEGKAVFTMPAPYMIDNAGEANYDVDVTLESNAGEYVITYHLPTGWMAAEERAWPVVLDPIVTEYGHYSNVQDQTVMELKSPSYTSGVNQCGWREYRGKIRSYVLFNELPLLSSADVIVDAYVRMHKATTSDSASVVEVRKVTDTWTSSTLNWSNKPDYGTIIEDFATVQNADDYYWRITDIVRGWYETGENTGMVFKAPDAVEEAEVTNYVQFWSSDYDSNHPELGPALFIIFRNSNGLESYWDYTSTSAGRAGVGYVNNYTGNLTWVHSDLGFGGNRMPVSISHIYNVNDYQSNTFGMGYGWRINYNQIIGCWNSRQDSGDLVDNAEDIYYWQDGDGTKHYFVDDGVGNLVDEDGLNLTLTVGSGQYTITDQYGNKSIFEGYTDSSDTEIVGRLTSLVNNRTDSSSTTLVEVPSSIQITYQDSNTNRIAKITDGAGRIYNFTYSNGLLSRISYTGTGTTEISYVAFSYTNSQLTAITYKDNLSSTFFYTDADADSDIVSTVLWKAVDIDGYNIQYTYSSTAPHRIIGIAEYDGTAAGSTLAIEYGHNQTTFTDHNLHVQITQFNDWGNVVSVQDDQGRAQFAQYAVNKYDDTSGKGNQLTLSSKLQNTVVNLLRQSSFESSNIWTVLSDAVSRTRTSSAYYTGTMSLKMTRSTAGNASGVYAPSISVDPGESYTFSAYVKTGASANAYLALAIDGTVVATSDTLTGVTTWTRLQVSYKNTSTAAVTLTPQFLTTTAGTVYMDCVQLEKAETASRYNLLENGDFSTTYTWSSSSGRTTLGNTAAPHLSSNVYKFTGNPTAAQSISQTVKVSGVAGDTFVLAGWAKGDAAPLTDDDRVFGLKLTFNYTDGNTSAQTVNFNTSCDSQNNWQYAATPAVAEKAYSSVTVELVYSYNVNDVYFDGIQLFKEEFGTSYTYHPETGKIISVKDLQNQVTTYEYDANGNLTAILQGNKAKMTYVYDDYHNVIRATTAGNGDGTGGVVYEFTYDAWGNNTSVSIVYGDKRITSTAEYSNDENENLKGNVLVRTTDALENVTEYGYNVDTNVLEWVQYPNDTAATRTEYTYDAMYRMVQTSADVDGGYSLEASYTYTDDLLTKIETNSSTYNFTYGAFDQISSIQVGTWTLASYTYTPNDQDRYLQQLTYGNNDKIQYTYDTYGRVIQETFLNENNVITGTVTYTYDNTGALATVTDSETGIKTTYYYDFTDRLMKYVEKGTNYSHSVGYEYDTLNNLTELVETINGVEHTTSYTYDDDNRVTGSISDGITQSYSYDSYGRMESRTASYNGGFGLYRSYLYATAGQGTSTQIVEYEVEVEGALITTTLSYDGNGNILSYDYGVNSTTYAYDSANQLVRENNTFADKTWVWAYDDAGNILSRTEYAYTTGTLGTPVDTVVYTYGDSSWGDLLTAYDGKPITYDGIGNPLTYDGWTFTWEHGRELASMAKNGVTWQYTYDANGMRTGRTNGATTYRYIYNGSQLTQMHKGADVLHFIYDASGTQVALLYNGSVYYYLTTLQGDTFAIADSDGTIVVEYIYDAWGKILSITGSMASTLGVTNPLTYRGYVYDSETGLYYLQSRYYNPEWGRFINADGLASAGPGLTSSNMFAYCANSPVITRDESGFAFDVVVDVVSAVISLGELIVCPSWANFGYLLWDIGSALVPFLPGSYIAKGGKLAIKVASKIDDLVDSSRFLTGTYNKLKKLLKGIKGIEIHHLIEKRFRRLFSCSPGDFLSIPLAPELHRTFTNRWRNLHKISKDFKNFRYGGNYSKITWSLMERAINEVYGDVPWLLDDVLEWFYKNWKG